MNILKLLGIIFALLVCMTANGMTPVNLCLTGKVELTLPVYKVAFLNAVNLALIQNPIHKNLRLKTYFFDHKPLSAIRVYNEMLHDHCSAIIGFEYLSDLLLVVNQQRDNTIPIFTSYASSSDSDKLPKNIFMFVPSYDFQAKKMMAFLRKKFSKIDNALLVTEIDRADLEKYKTAYKNILTHEHIKYDAFDFIGNDCLFENKLKKFVTDKHYNYVFVFSGAVGSTKILNYLNDHKTVFIGTENFGSSTNQSLYVRLNDKNITAFTIRNIDFLKTNNPLRIFRQEYTRKYNVEPSPLSVYTYDAVSIILKSLDQHHSVTTDSVITTRYNGISGAHIEDAQFRRSNQYVILSIGKNGFVYEE
jgi:ABC-type branched-subunit amino acid transport system substrate-binding protein